MPALSGNGQPRYLLALVVPLAGALACASVPMAPPTVSAETVVSMRGAHLTPSHTGAFRLAPGLEPRVDTALSGLRGSSLQPPQGTFSRYLAEAIAAHLRSAGLYDEGSSCVIHGELTENKVDAAIGTGTASLGARFTVERAGVLVYDKTLQVTDAWESSFIGAIAIPRAMDRYTGLYQSLAAKLLRDPDLHRVISAARTDS